MVVIARLVAEYDGDKVIVRASIPAEAHSVGLDARSWDYREYLGDDLGSPAGATVVADSLHVVATDIGRSLRYQWEGTQPLF